MKEKKESPNLLRPFKENKLKEEVESPLKLNT